ncbi:4-(cytidine 5'-diphospho)-2-C-methyl-D-erythritol kinase [Konateibacter massiliensis]|uniref:4-(cytidine 5'-diphospho)-2-C-methyl-D-erythritol kinase n=1 Tax=Konateibacter massiliensis TaxID=2002841 RepID=UPI000C15DF66|nr:4-(cytidine 5'-diphospho)-2-C-methyl-D-erythritol kinase [Konateibacter massiliensis]
MDQIKLKALAKINLGLDVVRKREDGYHEVRMIMQTINLYDKISIKKIKEKDIKVKTNLYYLPNNENNLVYKAAKLLLDEFHIEQGVSINLEKYIPVAAGMAGGSTDAAATLMGVNKLFKLGLSKKQLMERSVVIGADVPYCIMRGTALAEGIGEELTPLKPFPKCHILIAKPGISVSTKFVYGNLKADEIKVHPDIDGMVQAIEENDLNGVLERMGNVLEDVTITEYPIIEEIKQFMRDNGALNAMMSGSGPTVFGIFNDYKKARKAYGLLKSNRQIKQTFLTNVFNNRR